MAYKSEHLIAALKRARHAAGMSQRSLATRAGIGQSHISKIENEEIEPGLSSFIDLARALGLEPMLVPAKLIPAVETILNNKGSAAPQRAYLPDGDDDDA